MRTFKLIIQNASFIVACFISISSLASDRKSSFIEKNKIQNSEFLSAQIDTALLNKKPTIGHLESNTTYITNVQLNKISVYPNGVYIYKPYKINFSGQQLVNAVYYEGKYIPLKNLDEVVVSSDDKFATNEIESKSSDVKVNDHFANISVKQSFIKLLDYFIIKLHNLLSEIVPSFFS